MPAKNVFGIWLGLSMGRWKLVKDSSAADRRRLIRLRLTAFGSTFLETIMPKRGWLSWLGLKMTVREAECFLTPLVLKLIIWPAKGSLRREGNIE